MNCTVHSRDKINGQYRNVYKYGGGKYKRLHSIWATILKRCNNPRFGGYELYGGRGIQVCNEWHNYDVFAEWAVQNGYADNLQIDRINNNGNYRPENCRWVTPQENSNNRRSTTFYVYNGQRKSLKNWAREVGNIPYRTLHNRVTKLGWSFERAISTPSRYHRGIYGNTNK